MLNFFIKKIKRKIKNFIPRQKTEIEYVEAALSRYQSQIDDIKGAAQAVILVENLIV